MGISFEHTDGYLYLVTTTVNTKPLEEVKDGYKVAYSQDGYNLFETITTKQQVKFEDIKFTFYYDTKTSAWNVFIPVYNIDVPVSTALPNKSNLLISFLKIAFNNYIKSF